ncbi:putative oxidoreductase [Rubrobacter xylanophilus DSM 9941]|uniref:aldo/keto reductase n=1 Tax=Rubrobacter xylanophilus TaxID=49319 RepID=UPI001F24061C|nr:aldo/keto reductase [Rubrobacter xylanophilus]QYJ16721.1 putative oxidoreductase [Rubrobacter xylanophilus DSM 9941]
MTNGYQRAPLAIRLGIEPLGVGAWAWGTRRLWGYGSGYGRAEVAAALRESLTAGVRLVDTAEIYGNGESERIIGSILREGDLSARPVLATKFAPYPYRLSPRSLLSALDGSLRRLGVESVDLYQIHWYSPVPAPGGLLDALAEAVKEGKARHVGVSNYGAEAMRRAFERLDARGVPLTSNQVEYSLLHRAPETDGTLEACRELGVTLIAYSPLAQGLLTGKYGPGSRPPGLVRRLGRAFGERNLRRVQPVVGILREIGERHGKSPAQVSLNWLLAQGTLPIPGAKDASQARQNAGALGWSLSPEEKERLDLATLGWR